MNPIAVCCILFSFSSLFNFLAVAICFLCRANDEHKTELKEKILEQKILLDIYKKDISDDDLREAMKQYYRIYK